MEKDGYRKFVADALIDKYVGNGYSIVGETVKPKNDNAEPATEPANEAEHDTADETVPEAEPTPSSEPEQAKPKNTRKTKKDETSE